MTPNKALLGMQDPGERAWVWSGEFREVVQHMIQNPQSNPVSQSDWQAHTDRLARWLRQVEAARRLYGLGCPESLRVLYEYWSAVAPEDIAAQARLACETYRQFCFAAGA